jgi:hypothetical protein
MTESIDLGKTPVGTIEVRGQSFEIKADLGTFYAEVHGKTVCASTLEEVRRELVTRTRQAATKLNKRIVLVYANGKIKRGTLVSFHVGTDNPIVRWDGEKKAVQEPRLSYGVLDLDALGEEGVAKLAALRVEVQRLTTEAEALCDDKKLNHGALLNLARNGAS